MVKWSAEMAAPRAMLRRGCSCRLLPCYLVIWWWALYCITILEWRKLVAVELFGVEVCAPFAAQRHCAAPLAHCSGCRPPPPAGAASPQQLTRAPWVWSLLAQLNVPHVEDLANAERLVRAAPPPPPPLPPSTRLRERKQNSVAFLFLVKNKLDYVELWQRYFKKANPADYGIYFHFFDTRYTHAHTLSLSLRRTDYLLCSAALSTEPCGVLFAPAMKVRRTARRQSTVLARTSCRSELRSRQCQPSPHAGASSWRRVRSLSRHFCLPFSFFCPLFRHVCPSFFVAFSSPSGLTFGRIWAQKCPFISGRFTPPIGATASSSFYRRIRCHWPRLSKPR